MRKITYLLLLIFISTRMLAESPVKKFGKFNSEELNMNIYEKDSSASAVVLFDVGRSYFKYTDLYGFQLMFERHVRIKILKKSGYDYGNFEIPLYHSAKNQEKITELKAVTYNQNGGKIEKNKLSNSDIYEENKNENWIISKFSMPNVVVGSIIEVEYTIKSDFSYNLHGWEFQNYIPVLWSEYSVEIPEYYYYNIVNKGYLPFEINESSAFTNNIQIRDKSRTGSNSVNSDGSRSAQSQIQTTTIPIQTKVLKFAVKDAPAMKNEAYMLSPENYISQVQFELAMERFPRQLEKHYTQSWESVNEILLKSHDFGERLKVDKLLTKNDTKEIIAGLEKPEDKINAIYNYIKGNLKWNENNGIFTTSTLNDIFNKKTGNVSDINLLLVLFLQNAEIDAHPAVLSTRNHGLLNISYPSIDQMNYVVAYVNLNGKEMLLDATEPNCPITMLPPRCLNDKVRVISEKYSKWIEIDSKNIFKESNTANITINQNGSTGNIELIGEGYSAYELRKGISKKNNNDEYIQEFEEDNKGIKVNDYSIENVDDINKPVICIFNNVQFESIEFMGDAFYFSPVIVDRITNNPFKLIDRKFPVDYNYPIVQKYTFNYTIPENFKVEEIPSNETFNLPNNSVKYVYSTSISGNTIQVSIELNINKRIFMPEEYSALKELYNKVIDKENKQIVLKKN